MNTKPTTILGPETSILIVDDSQDYAKVLKRILQSSMGYENIETVSSIDDAYSMISKDPGKFSVLFVDYHFPNGDTGHRLLEQLKSSHLLDDKVAFFITAEPAVQKAIEATKNGLAGVVVKPFSSDRLQAQIQRAERDLILERATEEA